MSSVSTKFSILTELNNRSHRKQQSPRGEQTLSLQDATRLLEEEFNDPVCIAKALQLVGSKTSVT